MNGIEKKCTITTVRKDNQVTTVIESDSPLLKSFFAKFREAKITKQEQLRHLKKCDMTVTL